MGRLNAIGSSRKLRRELFPFGFGAEVMVLAYETWQTFSRHRDLRLEDRLTAIFRDALIDAYDAAGRRWFVTLEDPITDPTYGTELGRNDIRFYPPQHYRQTVYFAVECKRLHVRTSSGFKHLADKYVTQGLQRFVDGKYCATLPYGGMIGYVMDNRIDVAFDRVQREIKSRRHNLRMKKRNSVRLPSSVLSFCRHTADTLHSRRSGAILVHHLLVNISGRRN